MGNCRARTTSSAAFLSNAFRSASSGLWMTSGVWEVKTRPLYAHVAKDNLGTGPGLVAASAVFLFFSHQLITVAGYALRMRATWR